MEKVNETLKEMVKDNIEYIVKRLAQIDRLVNNIKDYDKLNEIDNLTYLEVNNTLDKIFKAIEKED